jgi:hypothetical protein
MGPAPLDILVCNETIFYILFVVSVQSAVIVEPAQAGSAQHPSAEVAQG